MVLRQFRQVFFIAPRLFFELANNPARLLGVRPSGVLIMRKLCKPADAYIKAEWSSGPVPEPVRCIYQCDLLSEPEISGNATGICAKVVPKRVQMSVLSVTLYSKLIPYLRKRK